jgi:hypothetical protein
MWHFQSPFFIFIDNNRSLDLVLFIIEDLEKIAEKVNQFWKDVFLNLSELKQEKGELVDSQHVLSQPIWLNPLIKIGDNMCMNRICCGSLFSLTTISFSIKFNFSYPSYQKFPSMWNGILKYSIKFNLILY